jgi:hypothetical protein
MRCSKKSELFSSKREGGLDRKAVSPVLLTQEQEDDGNESD